MEEDMAGYMEEEIKKLKEEIRGLKDELQKEKQAVSKHEARIATQRTDLDEAMNLCARLAAKQFPIPFPYLKEKVGNLFEVCRAFFRKHGMLQNG